MLNFMGVPRTILDTDWIKLMKHSYNVAVLVSLLVLCPFGAFAFKADEASTETLWLLSSQDRVTSDIASNGEFYGNRMKFFYEDNARAEKGCVVFLGDSITQGFPVDDAFCGDLPTDAKRTFVNRGIGGDHIEGMIQRLDVSIRDLQPRMVYIMAGTNDVLWYQNDYKEGNVKVGYERLARRIKELSPDTEIVFETMPPLSIETPEKRAIFRSRVTMANEQIKEVGKAMNIRVVDTHKALSDESGEYVGRYTPDGVHLNLLGNLQWIDALGLTPKEKARVWRNLAPKWLEAMESTQTLTGVNRPRTDDDFILYTPVNGSRTGTQKYSVEVSVVNDKITTYTIGWGNELIPKDGYVLSGRGNASAWLTYAAIPGSNVKIADNHVEIIPDPNHPAEMYETLRGMLLYATALGKADPEKYMDKIRDDKAWGELYVELKKLTAPQK